MKARKSPTRQNFVITRWEEEEEEVKGGTAKIAYRLF